MSLGLSNLGAPQQSNILGLSGVGQQNSPPMSGYGANPQYNNTFGASPLMGGILGGAGLSQQQYGMPVAPPSETQILSALLGTLQPIDKFLISSNMPVLIEMLSNLTTFSLLNVLKNATFNVDDEGTMALDVLSLPNDLQTLSAENIIAQLNSLQNTSMQVIQKADQERQQITAMGDQSMMQGVFGAAMADPGMLEGVGQAAGGFINRSIFGRGS
tara:strand:+ start:1562 stop:2206 length:645 start_codon:yes stop_codon:yes gene_type:complete